jgi:hypothetical protein
MKWLISGLILTAAVGVAVFYFWPRQDETITVVDYELPPADPADVLVDDRIEARAPLEFDPGLVAPWRSGTWEVNLSAAVLRLDVPAIKPDTEEDLLTLYGSYAAATYAGRRLQLSYGELLPSVNQIDGKAKQFDDGLYAALDQAYYRGLGDKLHGHVQWVRRLYDKVGKDHAAAPFLAAGLELAGIKVPVADAEANDNLLRHFRADEVASKPIGFYTWNANLADCFRFLRFFQREFTVHELAVPLALHQALAADKSLRADYEKAIGFYNKLTDPRLCLTLLDLRESGAGAFPQVCRDKKVAHETVAVFPPAASREALLFEKLFPTGLPPDADLMRELIRRVRSGEVDLRPRPDAGWYDYQVYALETLLLPEKAEERGKLLLTKAYKARMLEAFKALLTKRQETHARELYLPKAVAEARPPDTLKPRLRVEPCPTYYLRTARGYAFLLNFLEVALGKETLQSLRGLRKEGKRDKDLYAELQFMRDFFYGLYLMSAEDLGLKPHLEKAEQVDRDKCRLLANAWRLNDVDDRDLAADARVAVPVYQDPNRNVTRIWATIGVRLARLQVSFAVGPQIKPLEGGEWQQAERYLLGPSNYLIPVDEFAEVELAGGRTLNREELRALCDREKTREAILKALRSQ